jgi:AcrR family transcriptional regulator
MVTYQAIAAAIRQGIETGRLRPGERVPSTREITRQWGVAVATATKALQALQAEGLVKGVVGVGTVVADRRSSSRPQGTVEPRRRRPRDTESELTRERIVLTAVAIADSEGLPAVTMRRLAVELGVAVMSLYRHVPSKDELVVLMVDHILRDNLLPAAVPGGWRERIEAMARLQWRTVKDHTWMASSGMSMTRPLLVPNGMAQTDWYIGLLTDLGFDHDTALQIHLAIAGLLSGVGASLQLEVEAVRDAGEPYAEWMDRSEKVMDQLDVATRFPHLAAVMNPPDLDAVFDTGLALILDGLAQRLPGGDDKSVNDPPPGRRR